MLEGKKVLLGISGGIAAYKTPELARLLIKAGAEVRVIATHNALKIVSPITLATLTHHNIYSEVFDAETNYSPEHISIAEWGDVLLVAPATANIIGKFANGLADDALSTTFLAFDKPVFIAPAMNNKMYEHPIVQQNIRQLQAIDVQIIDPAYGPLACGTEGRGRMEEPENIVAFLDEAL